MPVTGSGYQPMQPPLLPLCGGADAAGAILRGRGSVDAARAFAKTSNAPNAAQQHRLDEEEQRLSNAQRGSGGGGGNAMERFHATFRAALTQELEALVRDLHAAVVEVPTRAMVGELVARWAFVLATYRAHVAAEDEVVLPALAARVNNVAHAYELEHEAEDELFDGITAALDEAVEAAAADGGVEEDDGEASTCTIFFEATTAATDGDDPSQVPAKARLHAAIHRAARNTHATKTALAQHLAKEAAHLVPLLNTHFTPEEQAALVSRFIACIPAGWVGPVLARGPSTGEQGPLRTLLASWLATAGEGSGDGGGGGHDGAGDGGGGGGDGVNLVHDGGGDGSGDDGKGVGKRGYDCVVGGSGGGAQGRSNNLPFTKRLKTSASSSSAKLKRALPSFATSTPSPIDHIFQFHEALRRELKRLEADVLSLPPPEDVNRRAAALRTLEGRFVFFWGVYRAHSRCEDELVFPALENKIELHNVSQSYTLDHEHEAELFVEVDVCLRDLRVAAGHAAGEAPYPGDGQAGDAGEARKIEDGAVGGDVPAATLSPAAATAAVLQVERRLQAACAAVRVCLETHVAREEAELWPLFEKHFTATEQGRLVGLIIGRTGAEVLQSMLSWQRKALTEEEKAAMIGSMRDASRNTRFASWLETWWSSEEKGAKVVGSGEGKEGGGGGGKEGGDAAAAAVDGLGQVQEYLKQQQQQQQEQQRRAAAAAAAAPTTPAAAAAAAAAEVVPETTEASAAAKARAEAVAAAAAADKTGYTPSWDDMFRMNRQQLEEAARAMSRDDSLAPERKAYLLKHLLAARWICAQQRMKQQGQVGRGGGGGGSGEVVEGDGGGSADAGVRIGVGEPDRLDVSSVGPTEDSPAVRAPAPGTAAAALAAAGAKRAMAYRSDGDDNTAVKSGAVVATAAMGDLDAGGAGGAKGGGGDSRRRYAGSDANAAAEPGAAFALPLLCEPILPTPPPPVGIPGCKHYARKARMVAACCGAAHVCRFCHDDAEDHTMDRYATLEMVCMACSARQPSAKDCRECGVVVARYFCSVCNFWDDSEDRDVYHCPFCNVCRRGKGLGKDFFHCMQCNSCVSLTMGPHKCTHGDDHAGSGTGGDHASGCDGGGGGGAMESDCPVCKDFLFTSDTPVKCLPCGHLMHTACFEVYTKHYYTCPLCRKSLGDFTAYFRMIDAILAEEAGSDHESGGGTSGGGVEGGSEEEEAAAVAVGRSKSCGKAKQRVACNDCGEETLAPFHFVYHACTACRSYNTRILGVVAPSEVEAVEAAVAAAAAAAAPSRGTH